MNTRLYTAIIVNFCSVQLYLNAQQINSMYFLENVPVRHFQNPAFIPKNDGYISPTIIGLSQYELGNNSLTFSDFLYNESSGTSTTFLENLNEFYNNLSPQLFINADCQTNFFGFGIRRQSAYWTFSMTDKFNSYMSVPKSSFDIAFFGSGNSNQYDLSKFKFNLSKYTELAVGYSKPINQNLAFGAKIKLNLGTANLSNENYGFRISPHNGNLMVNGAGTLNTSGFFSSQATADLDRFKSSYKDFLSPLGVGFGFDIGFEYKLNEKITLSSALLDVGFIGWSKSPVNWHYTIVDFEVDVIEKYNYQSSSDLFDAFSTILDGSTFDESLVSTFEKGSVPDSTTATYYTGTKAKFNIGLEYMLVDNYFSLGMLSNTVFLNQIIKEEVTVSAITKPTDWLHATISYSFLNGSNSFGAGIGLRTGILHWFVAADYIPFNTYPISDVQVYNSDLIVPYKSKIFNLAAGINFVFQAETAKKSKKNCTANRLSGLNYSDKSASQNRRKGVTVNSKLKIKSNRGLH